MGLIDLRLKSLDELRDLELKMGKEVIKSGNIPNGEGEGLEGLMTVRNYRSLRENMPGLELSFNGWNCWTVRR